MTTTTTVVVAAAAAHPNKCEQEQRSGNTSADEAARDLFSGL
jgi:hypothetical protein